MANPFLMDDDLPTATDPTSNPFLTEAADDAEEDFTADNPFAGGATNPFAFGDEEGTDETPAVDIFAKPAVPVKTGKDFLNDDDDNSSAHFFDMTIVEDDPPHAKPVDLHIKNPNTVAAFDDSGAYSSEDELKFKKKPGVPPRPGAPPSKATQDLITSVSNTLDQASSHLLDRIPKTRTPSPVSMRDLHSPSPTPDHMNFDDLVDVGNSLTGTDLIDTDNPFGIVETPLPQQFPVEDVHKPEPPRPRPPPPRPAVPPRVSPTSQIPPAIPPQPHRPPPPTNVTQPAVAHSTQEDDLFDMFGTAAPARPPKPAAPKTKEDILSLYSTPAPTSNNNNQSNNVTDLLSGDILDGPMDTSTQSTDIMSKFNATSMMQEVQQTTIPPEHVIPSSEAVTQLTPPDENENKAIVEEIIEPDESGLLPESVSPATATQFNMIITCEPDNPPSDDEVYDYQPTPSCQTPKQPDITAIHELISETEVADGDEAVVVNPFQSPPEEEEIEPMVEPLPIYQPPPTPAQGIEYAQAINDVSSDIFGVSSAEPTPPVEAPVDDAFDAFAAKFDSVDNNPKQTNIFLVDEVVVKNVAVDAWGDSSSSAAASGFNDDNDGFGNDEGFDSFLAMTAAPPKIERSDSKDSDEANKEFSVVIRPKDDCGQGSITPILAPPPKSSQNNSVYSGDSSPRFNPFDKGFGEVSSVEGLPLKEQQPLERTDSQESPATPLFDDDVSQPLEDFPRITYTGDGWEMQLRQPNKKRITAQRFWKKIIIKLALQGDNPVLQLYNGPNDKEPFQELPLQACYSVSDISAQQYDQFGKIFTVKLQYIFYKERPGVRPGQVTKAERITSKLSQFAAYAIQGDYQGVKEFGSDLKKLGIPVEHAPQVSELFKLGSLAFEDMKMFSVCIEEALFKLDVHRDRALNYKTEEVQITAVDELYVDQDAEGHVLKQIARVRLFFLGFLSGMPTVELGVNDLWRQGKEVVGRHDIIPVVTEEWIRLEGVEFHSCVQQDEYERTRTIKFQPPDACYIELMRFRIRPPKNRELPLQLKATWLVTGNKVELRADILVPGFASRKLGQIPCEDVMIRFPIPECWIYLFRVEKHFRYGSVKSAHRRTGKVKGIERILGAVEQLQESLIEVTSGSAKYEHQHRALVWRCPRLPKEGQGAYTTHQLVCRLALTSYDQIPDTLAPFCFVEFTMPATQASHTTVRSVSIQDSDSDDPPEKYVRYLARHEYKVGIEHTTSTDTNPYLAATQQVKTIREEPPAQPKPAASPVGAPTDSDSDSN